MLELGLKQGLNNSRERNWEKYCSTVYPGREYCEGNWPKSDIGMLPPVDVILARHETQFGHGVVAIHIQKHPGSIPDTIPVRLTSGQNIWDLTKYVGYCSDWLWSFPWSLSAWLFKISQIRHHLIQSLQDPSLRSVPVFCPVDPLVIPCWFSKKSPQSVVCLIHHTWKQPCDHKQ